MATGQNGEADGRAGNIRAIKACLDQLGSHAEAYGLPLAANLIGAASRAIADEIAERKVRKQDWTKPEDRMYDA